MSDRKTPEERSNREKPVYEDTEVYWDGEIRGPALPSGRDWHPLTKQWWQTVRRSPQAMEFQKTDWHYLQDTALFYEMFYRGEYEKTNARGQTFTCKLTPAEFVAVSNEIRKRIEPYGFTWAGRRKYGIKIVDTDTAVQEAESVTKTAAQAYRDKLNGLS